LDTIKQTHEFVVWLTGLRELKNRQRLAMRLRKASLGDVKALGDGVHERREHFAPPLAHVFHYAGRCSDRYAGRRRQTITVSRYLKSHSIGRTTGVE
jgi:hypothetical protein